MVTGVLMTCDKENNGSAKSIINNGGILENEIIQTVKLSNVIGLLCKTTV